MSGHMATSRQLCDMFDDPDNIVHHQNVRTAPHPRAHMCGSVSLRVCVRGGGHNVRACMVFERMCALVLTIHAYGVMLCTLHCRKP